MKRIITSLSVVLTLTILGACSGGNNVSNSNSGLVATDASLKTKSANTASATKPSSDKWWGKEGKNGKGERDGKGFKGHGDFDFLDGKLLNSLALTADQKVALKKISDDERAKFPKKDKTTFANKTNPQDLIKTAFLADTFDKAGLQAKLDANKPATPAVDFSLIKAQGLINRYNVLTADQKAKLDTALVAMDAKMANITPPKAPTAPTDAQKTARLDKMATALGLDATQKTNLAAVLASNVEAVRPDFAAMRTAQKATRDAVLAELKSATPSAEKIAGLLKANKPTNPNKGAMLDNLAKIHDILNADQRAKFFTSFGGMGRDGHGEGFGNKGWGGFHK